MNNFIMQKNNKSTSNAGFSLIELAVLLAVVGIIMAGLIQAYQVYSRDTQIKDTNSGMLMLAAALQLHYFEKNRLPAPSRPALSQTDPEYGYEFRPIRDPLHPDYFGINVSEDGFWRVSGQRTVDADGNPSGDPDDVNLSAVLIGGVPFKSINTELNLSRKNVFDGWGRQFTYAVTERMVHSDQLPEGYNTNAGTIGLWLWSPKGGVERHDPDEDQLNAATPFPNQTYVLLLSHGPDGMGAYTAEGTLHAPCVAGMRDSENCDNDSVFHTIFSGSIQGVSLETHIPGPYHFDDKVLTEDMMTVPSYTWETSRNNANNIRTGTGVAIGIGTEDMEASINVDGNIRIDSTTASDGVLRTQEICDRNKGDCFDTDLIGGPVGIRCPNPGQVLIGIANGAPICEYAVMSGVNPGECDPDQFIIGFDPSTGDIICDFPGL